MIVNKRTGFKIDKPKNIGDLLSIDHGEWMFFIPEDIKNDHDKVVYKVGFLFSIYKNISVKMANREIFKIINEKWQVFKSARQMERLVKKYNEMRED